MARLFPTVDDTTFALPASVQAVLDARTAAAISTQAIALASGIYRGPTAPTFYPSGATYQWFKTDPSSGALLDILNGVAP
jgi:hypothetical protein